ncbi:MAG: methyltransferase domain-containing protein [Firmicutes bacterium]|nr:methyltransferase domain-containing protein [Bacillota bacterium]
MGLNWMDVSNLSFNTLLLFEKVHFKWLPQSGIAKRGRNELAIAFKANPAVAWYAKNKCPEIAEWVDQLVDEVSNVQLNNHLVRQAEIEVMEALNDWIVYVVDPSVYDAQPFLNWNSDELLKLTDFNEKTVVDIGAGTGRLTFTVAPYADCVYAVEPVYNLREYVKKKSMEKGFNNVFVTDGLITDIPFNTGFADVTMSGHVFGDNLLGEWRELERITKPGGIVILCPGNNDKDNNVHSFLIDQGCSWSCFEEPGDGMKRKYWKTVQISDYMAKRFIHNAIQWAKEQLDSTDYKFLCLAFVEEAYERGNSIEIFGGCCAKESADMYEAHLNKGIPPEGAFVFYDCHGTINNEYKNWGHVGLCIGEGNIIHAWDRVRIDNYLDMQNLQAAAGWTNPKYIGWTPVKRILSGFKQKKWEELKK